MIMSEISQIRVEKEAVATAVTKAGSDCSVDAAVLAEDLLIKRRATKGTNVFSPLQVLARVQLNSAVRHGRALTRVLNVTDRRFVQSAVEFFSVPSPLHTLSVGSFPDGLLKLISRIYETMHPPCQVSHTGLCSVTFLRQP